MSKLLSGSSKLLQTSASTNIQIHKRSYSKPFGRVTLVPIDLATSFIQNLFRKLKLGRTKSAIMADCIIEADKRGKYPHGVFSLPKYVCAIENDTVNVKAEPKIIYENRVMASVCGANALGPIAGSFGMNLAIKKAKDCGASCVGVNYSNYFGMAGYYSLLAMRECLMGLALTNSPPRVLPSNGLCPILGTNALAFFVDAGPEEVFAFDMATSKMARETIEWCAENCKKIPDGVAFNEAGKMTNIPKQALIADKMLPFSDHRSYAITAALEILCGVLTGANYSYKFNEREDCSVPLNIGHFFIAVDPGAFDCNFDDNLKLFHCNIRDTHPESPHVSVRVPGDRSELLSRKATERGLPYNQVQKDILRNYALEYNIKELNDYIH